VQLRCCLQNISFRYGQTMLPFISAIQCSQWPWIIDLLSYLVCGYLRKMSLPSCPTYILHIIVGDVHYFGFHIFNSLIYQSSQYIHTTYNSKYSSLLSFHIFISLNTKFSSVRAYILQIYIQQYTSVPDPCLYIRRFRIHVCIMLHRLWVGPSLFIYCRNSVTVPTQAVFI